MTFPHKKNLVTNRGIIKKYFYMSNLFSILELRGV